MSIDEAIKHLKEKAEDNKKYAQECEECAKRKIDKMMGLDKIHRRVMQSCIKCIEEQEQLAEWLEELKEARKGFEENRKAGYSHGYSDGYNKAIDEFAELLKGNLIRKYANATLTQQYVALQVTDWCNEIAEQMKAGAE